MTTTAHELAPADRVRDFARKVTEAAGMDPEGAAISADAMVWADLRGVDAHGVTHKLLQCASRVRAGGTKGAPHIETLRHTPGMTVLEADTAWGSVAGVYTMRAAIANAREEGIGIALAQNLSSASAMGYYAEMATRERMIGLFLSDGPSIMPAWGGAKKLFGNSAHGIATPAGKHHPIVFDSSLSVMSTGEIDLFHERGDLLPEGVLYDEHGTPTRDPALWKSGMLAPAGGHRGYGLTVMFAILTGVLAGGPIHVPHVGHPFVFGTPQGVSCFALAIDPTVAMDYDEFTARVDQLIDQLHASPPTAGVERIYVPGERGALLAERRRREGIPFSPERIEKLRNIGSQFGVTW